MSSGDKKSETNLILEPTEFFRDEISKAFLKQKFKAESEVEYYLVDLMTRFIFSDNFFQIDQKGNKSEPTLALMLGDAMNAPDEGKKREDLRKVGDVSLYTAGFFADRIARKAVDVDYYIGMGSNAYSVLAQSALDVYFRKVFTDLSSKFVRYVDVLAEISSQTFVKDSQNLLRTYDLWLKTGSERAERQLKDAGLVPNKIKTTVQ